MTIHLLFIWAALLPAAGDTTANDASAKDLAKMQGDWMVATIVANGRKLTDDEAQTLFRTVTGNQCTISNFNRPISKVTIKIDATKTLKTIDSTPVGPTRSPPILGIYKFEGNKLTVCNSRPGMPRPTEFGAKAGSNQTEVVWQPEKK